MLSGAEFAAAEFDPSVVTLKELDEELMEPVVSGTVGKSPRLDLERLISVDSFPDYLRAAYALFLNSSQSDRHKPYLSVLPPGTNPNDYPLTRFAIGRGAKVSLMDLFLSEEERRESRLRADFDAKLSESKRDFRRELERQQASLTTSQQQTQTLLGENLRLRQDLESLRAAAVGLQRWTSTAEERLLQHQERHEELSSRTQAAKQELDQTIRRTYKVSIISLVVTLLLLGSGIVLVWQKAEEATTIAGSAKNAADQASVSQLKAQAFSDEAAKFRNQTTAAADLVARTEKVIAEYHREVIAARVTTAAAATEAQMAATGAESDRKMVAQFTGQALAAKEDAKAAQRTADAAKIVAVASSEKADIAMKSAENAAQKSEIAKDTTYENSAKVTMAQAAVESAATKAEKAKVDATAAAEQAKLAETNAAISADAAGTASAAAKTAATTAMTVKSNLLLDLQTKINEARDAALKEIEKVLPTRKPPKTPHPSTTGTSPNQ